MAEKLIINVSGLRGIVGENLLPSTAVEFGCAFGTFLGERHAQADKPLRVCIGRDSRPSGPMVVAAVSAGLCGTGIDVIDLGLVTTPSVGIMLRELDCHGGVVATASHNPLSYNGIKLILENGMAPPAAIAAQIRECFESKSFICADSSSCGSVSHNNEVDRIHIGKVLGIVDVPKIRSRHYKVIVDSVNGAGGGVATALLEALGCMVVGVNTEPTGLFAHEPEPTEANLVSLCEEVTKHEGDIGFAQDPDADRLAIVDHTGRYLGEEYTLAIAAESVLGESRGGKAAANLSTSRMIDDVALRVGASVLRTPVGEAHVAGAMIAEECIIGGEGNGGVIDLRVGSIRDSLVAMALVLDVMARTNKTIQHVAASLGSYFMLKDKFHVETEQGQQIIDLACQHFTKAVVNTCDGLRIDFDDGWLHLRMSNTEPVMRLIVEARNEAAAQSYTQQVLQLRNHVLS